MSAKRSKRAKPTDDGPEAGGSSYAAFASAANAVSQLYTAGVRERRATARNTLEKVLAFVLREYPSADYIPKSVLLQFLQHEYERADLGDAPLPPGAGLLPFMSAGCDDGSDADHPAVGGKRSHCGGGTGAAAHQVQAYHLQQPQFGSPHQAYPQQQHQQQQYLQQQQDGAAAANAMETSRHFC